MKLKIFSVFMGVLVLAGCSSKVAKQTLVEEVQVLDAKLAIAVISQSGIKYENRVISDTQKIFKEYELIDMSFEVKQALINNDSEYTNKVEKHLGASGINHLIFIFGNGTRGNQTTTNSTPSQSVCTTQYTGHNQSTSCRTSPSSVSHSFQIDNDSVSIALIDRRGRTLFKGEYEASSSRGNVSQFYKDSANEKIVKEFKSDLELNGFITPN